MGLLSKAVNRVQEPKASKKKATTWTVGTDPQQAQLEEAIHQLVTLKGEEKRIEAKMSPYKSLLKRYCEENFVRDFATSGYFPETPMQLVNQAGEKVTYVVQDRTETTAIKEDQVELVRDLLGEDGAARVLCNRTTFNLNPILMGDERVAAVVDKHLTAAVEELVGTEVLKPETADELVEARRFQGFKPGLVERLTEFCGRNTALLQGVLEAMGSACIRYVKAS